MIIFYVAKLRQILFILPFSSTKSALSYQFLLILQTLNVFFIKQ